MYRHLLFVFASLFVVSPTLAHADTSPQQAHQLQLQGIAAYKAGNFAEAAKDFAGALALRPHLATALYNLAASSAKAGKSAEAIDALTAYADMGLIADVEHDAAFAALKDQPAFKAVLAKFDAIRAPVGVSTVFATVAGAPFLAEGVAFDPSTKRFFVSSVDQRKIVALSPDGRQSQFANAPTSGLFGAFGLAVDGKRQRLWVASSAVPHAQPRAEDRGANGVFSFALGDGHLLSTALLPKTDEERVIGDVAVTADGNVFAPDSIAPVIYAVDAAGSTLSPWLRNENFISLQGVTTTPDGSHLIVADYSAGLHFIDVKTKALQTIDFADGATLLGIDGLYRHNDTLIAVQNGINPQRIIAISLDASGTAVTRVRVLSANDANIPEPSLGTVAGNDFCVVANAQWSRFKDDGTRDGAVPLDPVHIACISLAAAGI